MACCSCLTSFAYEPQQTVSGSCIPFDRSYNLFDSKLFISFDPNFPGLLECLLLDERDLIVCRKGWGEVDYNPQANGVKRTILFISLRTSSSFIGREAMAALL